MGSHARRLIKLCNVNCVGKMDEFIVVTTLLAPRLHHGLELADL